MLGGGGLRGKMTLSDSLSSSVTWGWRPVLREIDSVVKMCTAMGECTTALRTSTAQQQLLRATAGRCVSAVHRARTRHTAQLGAAGGGELLEGGNRLERYLQIIEIACAAIIERLNALEGKDKKELILNALEEFIAIEVKHAEGASARCLRAQVESCERWCDKNVFPAGGNMTVDTVGSSALDEAVGLDEFGDDGESDGEEEEESDAEGGGGGGVGSGEENENENEDDRDGGGRSSFSAKARTPFLPEERNYVDNVRPLYWIAIEALCSRLEVLHSSGSASHAIAASGRAVLGRHTVIWNGLDIDVRALPASRALRAAPRASIPRPTVHHSARLRLGDPTLPVVLLLGWWRSRPALLEKYAALYAARGFGTLALSATTFDMAAAPLAFLGLGLSALAGRILAELARMNDSANGVKPACSGVVVHAFSNGGALLYAELVKRAQTRGGGGGSSRSFAIRGAVFDSCPGTLLSPTAGVRAFLASSPSQLTLAASVVVAAGAPVALVAALHALLKRFGVKRPAASAALIALAVLVARIAAAKRREMTFQQTLRRAALRRLLSLSVVPELYLFSSADAIIPASGIKALIAHRLRSESTLQVVQRQWCAYAIYTSGSSRRSIVSHTRCPPPLHPPLPARTGTIQRTSPTIVTIASRTRKQRCSLPARSHGEHV